MDKSAGTMRRNQTRVTVKHVYRKFVLQLQLGFLLRIFGSKTCFSLSLDGFLTFETLCITAASSTCINSAWPLCTGFRSWKANIASAFISLHFARSSFGVKRSSSSPSFHRTRSITSRWPPTSQSPLS